MMKRVKTKITDIHLLERVLARHSHTKSDQEMEPINLIVIGNKRYLNRHFKLCGWYRADKIGAISLSKALVATIFSSSYRKGPMADSYIGRRHFEMAYEKPTRSDTYRRRHHLRLWRTPYKFFGRRIWAGTLSYDRSAGVHEGVLLTHHISPTLRWEEDFLAASLGIHRPSHLTLDLPYKGQLNNGDSYDYDGKALVLNLGGRD